MISTIININRSYGTTYSQTLLVMKKPERMWFNNSRDKEVKRRSD